MKDVPDIVPEIRSLLEEIVADPRSAIRLAPRRALSTWFDTGETARASQVSQTKAERHLIELHREALAALLCEASWISYWKAPELSCRPVGADGRPYQPTEREPDWRRRAEREVCNSARDHDLGLLRQCLTGIKASEGSALARASLSLIPSDKTRCYVALNAQWNKPRTAIALFSRLAGHAQPARLRPWILISLGAQTCHLGLLSEARDRYRESSALDPGSPFSWGCAFNLSCFLGDEKGAREDAAELGRIVDAPDPRVLELRHLLEKWRETRTETELSKARGVIELIGDRLPGAAKELSKAFEP